MAVEFGNGWLGRLAARLWDCTSRGGDQSRGFRRIYFIHIRKTGGTSLNHMFLSLASDDSLPLYQELCRNHAAERNGKRFVGWRTDLIDEGNYFYAFSHSPLHDLKLPSRTFTVTCFRDPVRRVISLYEMLLEYVETNNPHPCTKTQGPWVGNSFDDFVDRVPQDHLLRQLYMFSRSFDLREAAKNIRGLSHCFSLEHFDAGVEELNRKTGLELRPQHRRKSNRKTTPSEHSLRKLRDKLAPEYELLRMVADCVDVGAALEPAPLRLILDCNQRLLN